MEFSTSQCSNPFHTAVVCCHHPDLWSPPSLLYHKLGTCNLLSGVSVTANLVAGRVILNDCSMAIA
ncbi:G-protein coupled receptor 12-like [Sesbania bispinosa]|nr:G-protein coupled receptor 12-like [Sesbania bispinosa]